MIEISKNVPLPKEKTRNTYPYEEMDVGDSFFVSGVTMQNMCNMNGKAAKKYGGRFIARRENEGIRVWKTE